jgi:hypothetical protein
MFKKSKYIAKANYILMFVLNTTTTTTTTKDKVSVLK